MRNRLVASKKNKRYILRVNVAQMINWVHENSSFLSTLKTRFFVLIFDFSGKMGELKKQSNKARKDAVDNFSERRTRGCKKLFEGIFEHFRK